MPRFALLLQTALLALFLFSGSAHAAPCDAIIDLRANTGSKLCENAGSFKKTGFGFDPSGTVVNIKAQAGDQKCDHLVELQLTKNTLNASGVCQKILADTTLADDAARKKELAPIRNAMNNKRNLNMIKSDLETLKGDQFNRFLASGKIGALTTDADLARQGAWGGPGGIITATKADFAATLNKVDAELLRLTTKYQLPTKEISTQWNDFIAQMEAGAVTAVATLKERAAAAAAATSTAAAPAASPAAPVVCATTTRRQVNGSKRAANSACLLKHKVAAAESATKPKAVEEPKAAAKAKVATEPKEATEPKKATAPKEAIAPKKAAAPKEEPEPKVAAKPKIAAKPEAVTKPKAAAPKTVPKAAPKAALKPKALNRRSN